MRQFFFNFWIFFCLISCSNIEFVLEEKDDFNILKNKTTTHVSGWENSLLKEVLFLKLGVVSNGEFILTAEADEKQTKRSINENQVAQKIDYKISVNYKLVDTSNRCPDIQNTQKSSFSVTPKSSGYNFASDVLLQNLLEESVVNNVTNFLAFANETIKAYGCIDED